MRDVEVTGEVINLQQLLQLAGVVDTGGEAKNLIGTLAVAVNGEPEGRRGRKLRAGDVVEVADGESPARRLGLSRLRLGCDDPLDPAVGQEPDHRDGDEQRDRDPGLDERERRARRRRHASEILPLRSLPIACASCESGLVQGEQRQRQQRERDRAAEQDDRVGGDRPRLGARLAEPGGAERR